MAHAESAHAHSVGCALAHGEIEAAPDGRALVAVFDTLVAAHLMHFAVPLGFRVQLAEPTLDGIVVDDNTDIVVTSHDRPELGAVLRDALATPARWIGVMGSPRHTGPHVEALRELGLPESEIARVHRPIGLDIGSRTPAEIALSTLAGLLADRNAKPGGFAWRVTLPTP